MCVCAPYQVRKEAARAAQAKADAEEDRRLIKEVKTTPAIRLHLRPDRIYHHRNDRRNGLIIFVRHILVNYCNDQRAL